MTKTPPPSARQNAALIDHAIGAAIQHLSAGNLGEAEGACRQVLQIDPNQPDALHLLGGIAHQVGKSDIAVDLISKSIAAYAQNAEAHYNLGVVFESLGKPENAVASYRNTLSLEPRHLNALNNMGNAYRSLGKADEAISSYRQALSVSPDFSAAHNNLGNVFKSIGSSEDALDSYRAAITHDPGFAEAHSNLGIMLQEVEQLEDAIISLRQALSLKPNYAEGQNNLGSALKQQGKTDEAISCFRKALEINPNYSEAHNNLGNAQFDQGNTEDAVISYRNSLALNSNLAQVHNNLGNALKELEQLADATSEYHTALTIDPDFSEAHYNLGNLLYEQGHPEKALKHLRHAVTLSPDDHSYWTGFAAVLEVITFSDVDDGLWMVLDNLLDQPMVRPTNVARSIISALRLHPDFVAATDRTVHENTNAEIDYNAVAGQLSDIPLLIRIMGLSPIHDIQVERILTSLRHAFLMEVSEQNISQESMLFSSAMALQCFTNEYVFSETSEEKKAIETLQDRIETLIGNSEDVPPALLAALGSYRPLYSYPWATSIKTLNSPHDISDVIKRQISEPLKEQALRSEIPSLTPSTDVVSQSVREQYEENPYPRWVVAGLAQQGKPIDRVLNSAPYYFDLDDYDPPKDLQVLIGGCGTGLHALMTASSYSDAHVLAIDLSLSSLSYARRKTEELGITHIDYNQADILELGNLDRQFDLVESVGVLHHLGDPMAGWQVLVDLLKPGGMMKIGLYSETARKGVVEGRSLIAEKGYTSSPDDIRRCRQDIIAMREDGNKRMAEVCAGRDFFSLSECRDLLFHVQEHRFTLPEIEEALKILKLEFLGFALHDLHVQKKFMADHPDRQQLGSLALWHEFELKNPDTFRGMYQFWCRKKK
jgi:tetratricopeptide (TPR) repeat protein